MKKSKAFQNNSSDSKQNLLPKEGKLLGVDYGSRKVGLAISDPDQKLGFPLKTIANRGQKQLLDNILSLMEERDAKGVVMGWSVDIKGNKNPIMRDIENFAGKMRKAGMFVDYEPETLTTNEAAKTQKKGNVDASAAALILQGYLDRRNN